jgi:hypothetical protein
MKATKASGRALLALLCLASCSKKEPAPHRTEPWLAHPSASISAGAALGGAPQRYHFSSDSQVRFTLVGKKGKVSGRLPLDLAHATLRLDPRDLKSTRASIDVDLTKLSMDAEALPENVDLGGSTPNDVALQWLELGADVAPERRRELGSARFELASVETSTNTLDLAARRQQSARATVVGTLLLHGFRAPVRTDVVLTPVESPAGAPQRFSIRSVGALVVPLAPHGIAARGPSGIVDALGMARSANWVGRQAKVEFELFAEADTGAN